MLIDSHCHLEYDGLIEDQAAVLQRARDRNVCGFLNISTKQSEWQTVCATAERHDDVWAAIGVHPHNADSHSELTADMLANAARHPKVVGLGETGLDYYYEHSDRALQKALFRRHIAAARDLQLPVVIHTRNAEDDTLAILTQELAQGPFPALIHCFTASASFGQAVLDLGLFISLSGIVTFKNAKELQDFARVIPADRLLVETDSPFLAPVPNRGKRCEPAYVCDTAAFLADLRGEPIETFCERTTQNFFRLFAKAKPCS